MTRCIQYDKPIAVPKDRFAFLFLLSQKKVDMMKPQSMGMDGYNALKLVLRGL